MILKPGKYTTLNGSEAEVFAERDGYLYGRVGFSPCRWFACSGVADMAGSTWNILPPEPVKKWRWVMDQRHIGCDISVTIGHFATAAEAEACYHGKALQRIGATEIGG